MCIGGDDSRPSGFRVEEGRRHPSYGRRHTTKQPWNGLPPTSGGVVKEGGKVVWDNGIQTGVPGITGGDAEAGRIALEVESGTYAFTMATE